MDNPDADPNSQPYAPAVGDDRAIKREPVSSFTLVFVAFIFNWLCHAATTHALVAYIDKTAGGPTSKAIDLFFYGTCPIGAATIASVLTIFILACDRLILRRRSAPSEK